MGRFIGGRDSSSSLSLIQKTNPCILEANLINISMLADKEYCAKLADCGRIFGNLKSKVWKPLSRMISTENALFQVLFSLFLII